MRWTCLIFLSCLVEAGTPADEEPDYVISGLITNEQGQPISGALVEWGVVTAPLEECDTVHTDEEGRYALPVSDNGPGFRLGVSAEGHAPAWQDFAPQWDISQPPLEREDVPPPVSQDFVLAPGVDLAGTVVDEDGVPVGGVEIHVQTERGEQGYSLHFGSTSPPSTRFPGSGPYTATSNTEGAFAIRNLPNAMVSIGAKAPYYYFPGFNVLPGEPCEVRLQWSGREGEVAMRVEDSLSSLPVERYIVARRHVPKAVEVRDENGVYTEGRLTRGREYQFFVYARGYLPSVNEIKATNPARHRQHLVALEKGPSLELQLVERETGLPAAGVEVLAGVTDKYPRMFWAERDKYIDGHHGFEFVQRGKSDEEGRLWLAEGAETPLTIFVAPTTPNARAIFLPQDRGAVEEDGVLVLPLERGAIISGSLTGIEGHMEPAVGLRRVETEPIEQEMETLPLDEDGQFRFTGLAPGNYQLSYCRKSNHFAGLSVPVGEHLVLPVGAHVKVALNVGQPSPQTAATETAGIAAAR